MRWILCALFLTACNQGSSGGGGSDDAPAPTTTQTETPAAPDESANDTDAKPEPAEPAPPALPPADPRTAAFCEADWRTYVANQQVGLRKAYERKTRADGVLATESTRVWRETVTAVTDDSVTYERVEQTLLPRPGPERRSNRTTTKAGRFNDCLGIATTTDPTVVTTELSRRAEGVAVRAGSFESIFVETRETGTDDDVPYELHSKIWTIDDALDVVAKAETVYVTTKNGAAFTEKATLELTELSRP